MKTVNKIYKYFPPLFKINKDGDPKEINKILEDIKKNANFSKGNKILFKYI